jgi:hypothetical protein
LLRTLIGPLIPLAAFLMFLAYAFSMVRGFVLGRKPFHCVKRRKKNLTSSL